MSVRKFHIFRSADAELEFRGLRGRYVYIALGGGAGLMLLSMILYTMGLPLLVMLVLLGGGGGYGVYWCFQQNAKHGRWGHLKADQNRLSPDFLHRHHSFSSLLPTLQLPRRTGHGSL